MGKRITRKTFKLSFQPDTPLDGLTTVVRGLSLGKALELQKNAADKDKGGAEGKQAIERMVELLAEHLVEWDAEDEDGVPIPPTVEGLLSQDVDFVMSIIDAWQSAVTAATSVPESDPLPGTSTGGQPSVEASIPMDVPSESLAS